LGLGLRHGIDWDHIAAITDLSGTAENRRRGFVLSMAYAIGHGAVVFALGTLAIAFGLLIPESLEVWMGRIVGLTLIALGGWILVELTRKGRNFRLRSRWMLVIDGTFAGLRRVRNGLTGRSITIEHEHVHTHSDNDTAHDEAPAHDHAHIGVVTETVLAPVPVAATGWRGVRERMHQHNHRHSHALALPDRPDVSYGRGTATGIGMLHGVGIESPTQIAIFVASTSVAGVSFGLMLLGAWVIGLIVANAGLALLAGAGLLNADRSFPVYAAVAIVVSSASILLGTFYLFGLDVLPAIS
jgi:ABC-type nickel/cobalt efflux system permease component RcnA